MKTMSIQIEKPGPAQAQKNIEINKTRLFSSLTPTPTPPPQQSLPMRNYGNPPMNTSEFKTRLRQHIQETYRQDSSTQSVDDLVTRLRKKYRQYRRHKFQLFTKMVKQNLDSPQNNTIINKNGKRILKFDGDDDDMTSNTPVSKKSKENDSQMLETDDLMSESEENISSVSKGGDDDEVYCLQFKPDFDLTKSMLRNKYNPKTDIEKPKNVEVEVVANSSNKEMKNVDLVKEDTGVKTSAKMKDDEHDKIMFKDLGGIDGLLDELIMQVIVPLYHPNLHRRLGVKPISGILLHGPPGCGKTSLALAIANETGIPFYMISATELVSGVSGASEESIRELFSKAYRTAPSIVFIDEIDAIASKRENQQREMERRIVTQLMTCMDESHRPDGKQGYVLVIGATNRPDAIDPALRRPGRFDRELLLGVPDENARTKILSALTRKVELEGAFDLVKISRATTGFVGADLYDLVNTAGNVAIRRIVNRRKSEISKENTDTERILDWLRKEWTFEEMEKHSITMSDFEVAAKLVQPSLRREGFSSIPNVKWEDVGGLDELRREFYRHIVRRIKYPDTSEGRSRVKRETGFLLYGPPGCGKTLIAKAVANEAGANFILIKGPELLSKYVGESELAMRTLFSRARTCAPCVLFFDEVDALTTKRGKEGGWVVERLLNQLLIELDGADESKGVYIIGATNRPEVIDPAVLRSGRFGKHLYVPLPTPDERGLILKALARTMQLDADVDLIAIGKSDACDNFSGADLSALINEAVTVAEDEEFSKTEPANPAANEGTSMSTSESSLRDMPLVIKAVHFDQVLGSISPSVSDKQIQFYNGLQKIFNPKHRT